MQNSSCNSRLGTASAGLQPVFTWQGKDREQKVKIYVISLIENDQMLEGEMKPMLFAF